MEHITKETLHAVDSEIMRLIEIGEMTKETLDCLDKLVDIKKDLAEISAMEAKDSMENEQSYNYRPYGFSQERMMPYPVRDPYNSYAPKRNRMGQFSRDSERSQIMSKIEQMLDTAQNSDEREMIHRILNEI